jgi:glutathione synthase/RimK-type ligase-like ATP-grasp enzyme
MSELYSISEWEARQEFVRLIGAVCREQGIALAWLSDYWLGMLEKNGVRRHIHGYQFPLNDTVAANIMHDKVSTFELLTRHHLPAIPHFLVRLEPLPTLAAAAKLALTLCPLPFVLKPNAGWSGGIDVFKCRTEAEVIETMQELARRHQVIAVSPFTDIKAEYRVLLLDDEPKVVFEKVRQKGAWHHNLKRGAVPQIVDNAKRKSELVAIAKQALLIVQGRVAAVDIVDTPAGYQIMELNCGISLSAFSTHSAQHTMLAHAIYTEIITKSFAS